MISRSLVVAFALLLTMGVTLGRTGIASAQDATPAAGECDAPALPPGTPTPMEEASPEGEDMAGMDHGTPAVEDAEAAPAEEAAPAGTPADDATTAEVQAGAQNIINCFASGNVESVAALLTPAFIQGYFGVPTVYDVLDQGHLEGAPYGEDTTVDQVLTYDDGSVSVDVLYAQSSYQTAAERWTLVQDGGYWKMDNLAPIEAPAPEGDTAVVGVVLTEYAFAPNVPSVVQMPVITFHLQNQGVEDHEMVLLRLPEGVAFDEVMADEALQEQVEFIGFGFAAPGEESDAHFAGLEPGIYHMVCFVQAPDGEEHVAKGMVAEFEVTAAS
jgi:hypothetical protein